VASTNRKKLRANVDLPHPVDPTIPIFSLGATEKLIPCNTSGKSGWASAGQLVVFVLDSQRSE
jgi:hypothetical protein